MATKIEYNGSVVATIPSGNKATIPVADKKMKSDIVITVPEGEGGTDSPLPIEVSTEAEMTALLTSGEVDGIYKYTGESTDAYENGALYILTYLSGSKFWRKVSIGTTVPYLTFSSPSSFTLATSDAAKSWDGVLEYSTDTITWNEWDGTTTLSADSGKLYMRGTGNTLITGFVSGNAYVGRCWVLTGSEISCIGNIENLLDYATVASGRHPTMTGDCFTDIFNGCTSLISAPELPATTLADYCYFRMFLGCTGLTSAPKLPATTLVEGCYMMMFYGCTSLTSAPELPATTLAESCYQQMFYDCTNLITAPYLPATTLAKSCYDYMFYNCISLTRAPALPATTLAESCYQQMFYNCTSLTSAPELPATTLAESCYGSMFYKCTSLISAPELPATILTDYCYDYMFSGCTSLITPPELPATTLAKSCYGNMFEGCSRIKLSLTQTDEYQTPYRIPTNGIGTFATTALQNMFSNTGGTFTGTPKINTTYYLDTRNTVGETLSITENGTYDVVDFVSVEVNVEPALQEKTVTKNGEVTADEGYDGLSKVTVAVEGEVIPEHTEAEDFTVMVSGSEGEVEVSYDVSEKVALPSGHNLLASVSDENFIANNIKKGVSVFGLEGAYEGEGEVIEEYDGTAVIEGVAIRLVEYDGNINIT